MRTFVPRFVDGSPPGLWKSLAILEAEGADPNVIRAVHYLAASRSEPLIRDFVLDVLWPKLAASSSEVPLSEVIRFIRHQPLEEFGGRRWSESVETKVARGLLAALRDFGILDGKSTKRLSGYGMPLAAFGFIAFILKMKSQSGHQLLHDSEWRLFFLSPHAVETYFIEAQQAKFLTYDAAGKVIRVGFPADTLEEYAHVVVQRTS